MTIIIGKVKDEGGCWGNMAPFPVEHEGNMWLTTEAMKLVTSTVGVINFVKP